MKVYGVTRKSYEVDFGYSTTLVSNLYKNKKDAEGKIEVCVCDYGIGEEDLAVEEFELY